VIRSYPPLARCTCQGTSFHLELEYRLRKDGEVERVGLTTHCTQCRKAQRRMSVRIDYSPTKRLLTRPLVACPNPHILYDLKELTLYAQPAEIVRVVDYLAERGCSLAGTVGRPRVGHAAPHGTKRRLPS
jgi:hypothetical protein